MDLEQLAAYLQRDARELSKLVNRGYLPGKKVGGVWRFASSEINHWIETQMHAFTEQELEALEQRGGGALVATSSLVSSMLSESTIALPLLATTKASVLKELVNLAAQSWQVYDADVLLNAIKHREELGTTALESGVADKIYFYYAPKILGGTQSLPVAGGAGRRRRKDAIRFRDVKLHSIAKDEFAVEAWVERDD